MLYWAYRRIYYTVLEWLAMQLHIIPIAFCISGMILAAYWMVIYFGWIVGLIAATFAIVNAVAFSTAYMDAGSEVNREKRQIEEEQDRVLEALKRDWTE